MRPLPALHPAFPLRPRPEGGQGWVSPMGPARSRAPTYWCVNSCLLGGPRRPWSRMGLDLNSGPFSFSLAPCPPSYPRYHQWNLHRVPEWHAEHLTHRPELYPGGANRVLRTRQGATNRVTLGCRASVTRPLWTFVFPSVKWISSGGLIQPVPFWTPTLCHGLGTSASFQHGWFPSTTSHHLSKPTA